MEVKMKQIIKTIQKMIYIKFRNVIIKELANCTICPGHLDSEVY